MNAPWPQKGMSLLQAVSGGPWRANAQMYLGPDWVAYQHGYELATRLLLERAASGRDQDVLIFPILFNARQAIELALKEIVVIGIRLGHTEPYPMTHNLLTLWVAANRVLVEAGADEEESTTAFEALLRELHVADPTAITFRYPEDTKRGPSFRVDDGPIPSSSTPPTSAMPYTPCSTSFSERAIGWRTSPTLSIRRDMPWCGLATGHTRTGGVPWRGGLWG